MLTVDRFLDIFAEFASVDFLKIETTIAQIVPETCGYSGIESSEVRELALSLHSAHILECYRQTASELSNGKQVKKYKSNHDEIEYQLRAGDPYDFCTTTYGARLQQLLDSQFIPICF